MITNRHAIRRDLGLLCGAFRRPRYRSMHEFACQEIVLATGAFEGRRFSTDRQPFMKLWFDAVDSARWTEMVITGPSQSGKSLCGFTIPLCYYLFEMCETVIAAVPDDDIVRDKWDRDIEPIISRTKYRTLLPTRGPGSKGGRTSAVQFKNGAMLRWMTAGGSDKSRAGFTARVICMTETDGFDVRTSTSEEANKISQIEARTRSFPLAQRRIFKECTLTTADGHTWQRYSDGTASEVHMRCPHCRAWVMPGRDDLHGWQDAATDAEALLKTAFACPQCSELWSEQDRRVANHNCRLVHRGQHIEPNGTVAGDGPDSTTLGFRWSAVHNLLVPANNIGVDEWKATRAVDEDDEERKLCQFVWAVPYQPKDLEGIPLAVDQIKSRQLGLGRGQIPEKTRVVTIGVDVNANVLHWTAISWQATTGHVIDYGTTGVKTDELGFDKAIAAAVSHLHQKIGSGWSSPEYKAAYIDCRYNPDDVIAAVKAINDQRWRGFMGMGHGHWKKGTYAHPEKQNRGTIWVGKAAQERFVETYNARIVSADANYWKTWLHSRLSIDLSRTGEPAKPGAITLFSSMNSNEHSNFAKHLTAEKETVIFERGRGYVKVWETLRAQNHWLDATYMACVAGHRCGFEQTTRPTQYTGHLSAMPQGDAAPTFYSGGEDGFTAPTF